MNGWPIDFLYANAAIVRTFDEDARDVEVDRRCCVECCPGSTRTASVTIADSTAIGWLRRREALEEVLHVLVDQAVPRELGAERLALGLVGSSP